MDEHILTMKIVIRKWEVDLLLVDEEGELIASNRIVFPKPASVDGIKHFMDGAIYRFADTFKDALYIWDDTEEEE